MFFLAALSCSSSRGRLWVYEGLHHAFILSHRIYDWYDSLINVNSIMWKTIFDKFIGTSPIYRMDGAQSMILQTRLLFPHLRSPPWNIVVENDLIMKHRFFPVPVSLKELNRLQQINVMDSSPEGLERSITEDIACGTHRPVPFAKGLVFERSRTWVGERFRTFHSSGWITNPDERHLSASVRFWCSLPGSYAHVLGAWQ
jgi:hypothetical protein